MKLAINIIKNLLLPKLEKDSIFDNKKINASFWETVASAFLNFDTDAKPLYAAIYALELENAEKIISKLPLIYADFIKELAESYVLGETSDAINHLLQTKNPTFKTEVQFFEKLKNAIKKVERKRMKSELPTFYEKLTFELSEEDMESAVKKKGREALKQKMKVWDEELVETDAILVGDNHAEKYHQLTSSEINEVENYSVKKETKIFSLSWIKYAAAACILITAGVFYFNSSQPKYNRIINNKENDSIKKITNPEQILTNSMEELAYTITVKKDTVLFPTASLGFAKTEKVNLIEIQYKDASLIISKLNTKINEEKNDSILNALKSKLRSVQIEHGKYEFDGNILTLYSSPSKESNLILTTDGKTHFIKIGELYYKLLVTKSPMHLNKITEPDSIEQLDKIVFDNDK